MSENVGVNGYEHGNYPETGYFEYTTLVYCCQGGDAVRLQELRRKRGISQLKLAMDLGLNQNSISRYESGVREADYRTLIQLADYFNVSVDYLLERTNNPKMNK